MNQVSPEGLRMINYCNGIESFVNYITSNPKNISGCSIRCSCKMYKIKKKNYISICCYDASILQSLAFFTSIKIVPMCSPITLDIHIYIYIYIYI